MKDLYNYKIKTLRKAILAWLLVWVNMFVLITLYGVVKPILILMVAYDLSLHIATFLKDPYERKWGWMFYPVIFQKDEPTEHFDFRYHLFWIPYWATVLFLLIK